MSYSVTPRVVRRAAWWTTAAACLAAAILNSRFLVEDVRGVFHRAVEHLDGHSLELYAHLVTGPLILLAGVALFHESVRARRGLHRWMGRFYLTAILLTAPLTLRLALAEDGTLSRFGFTSLGLLWLATAAMAWWHAARGEITQHRAWVVRSFALTLTNVTYRAELHVLLLLGAELDTVYEPLRTLQFIPNLIAAELLLRSGLLTASCWSDLPIARRIAAFAPGAAGITRPDPPTPAPPAAPAPP